MHTTTQRRFGAGVTALSVGLALSLAACGNSGPSNSASGDQKPTSLNAIFLDTAVYTPCVKEYVDKFTQQTGISVNVSSEGYSNYHDKLLTTLASGSDTYDLIMLAYQWTGELEPFITPITSKVAADSATLGGILDAATKTYIFDNEQYAIPFTAQAETLFYRTDLLKEAGLTPPKTWDEFTKVAKFFTNNPDYPGVYGTSVKAVLQHAGSMFNNRYYGMGGKPLGEKGSTMDEAIIAKALTQLKSDTVEFSPPGGLAASFAETSAHLAQGTAVMAELMPTTVLGLVNTESDTNKVLGKIGATVVPGGHGEAGGWGLGVSATSTAPDAAYDLAKYLTSEEADLGCFLKHSKPAVQKATYENAQVTSAWQTEGVLAALSSSIGKARGATAAEINAMMDEVVARYLADQAGTAEQAAHEMADKYANLVDKS